MQETTLKRPGRGPAPEIAVSGALVSRERRDLLGWPLLGALLRNRRLLQGTQLVMLLLLIAAVGYGLWIPSAQENHVTTGILWGIFWPFLVIVTLPTLGRVVCTVCPHGLIARTLSPHGLQKKLPRRLQSPWIGLTLLILSYWIPFYAFEPFDDPWLTAMLFLGWTLLAVAVSLLLRGVAHCRYFCPIGAILTTFNKVSFTWLDSHRSACDACRTFDCAKSCDYGLSPFNFERRGSMQDCTLCMECASSCPSIRWRLVRPGYGLVRAQERPSPQDTWVSLTMIAVITLTMHLHHGLGHSALGPQLPWNRLGTAIIGHWPWLREIGLLPGGLLALLLATIVTFATGLGGLAAAGKVAGIDRKTAFTRLGPALAPIMIVGGLSHVTEFFFLHYAHDIANAFIQLFALPLPWQEPLARHGEPWLRVFSVFKYLAFLFSVHLCWQFLKSLGVRGVRRWLAFPLASLLAWVYLASVLFNSYVYATWGAAPMPHH